MGEKPSPVHEAPQMPVAKPENLESVVFQNAGYKFPDADNFSSPIDQDGKRDAVENLYIKRVGRLKIKEGLGLSRGVVDGIVGKLIAQRPELRMRSVRLTGDVQREFDSKVKDLRDKGLTDKQISEELGRPLHIIYSSVRRLISSKSVKRKSEVNFNSPIQHQAEVSPGD